MTYTNIAIILLSVSLNAFAQIFLKKGADACLANRLVNLETLLLCVSNLYFWLGFLCYAISILSWIFVLSKMNVSLAYPFLAFGFVLSIVLAYVLLGEAITLSKITAIFFICVGLIILSLGAQK